MGFAKKDGGTRGLVCGWATRRLAAKAARAIRRVSITEAASSHQFLVGHAAGLEAVHKAVTIKSEACGHLAFVSIDMKSAFTGIARAKVIDAFQAGIPQFAGLCAQWPGTVTKHEVSGTGFGEWCGTTVGRIGSMLPASFAIWAALA